jgi:hypothetical protein
MVTRKLSQTKVKSNLPDFDVLRELAWQASCSQNPLEPPSSIPTASTEMIISYGNANTYFTQVNLAMT